MSRAPETAIPDAPATLAVEVASPGALPLARAAFAPVKFLLGMAFTQSVFGALLVLGWTQRLTRRSVLKHWWRQASPAARGGDFVEWLREDETTASEAHWPNWVIADQARAAWRSAATKGGPSRLGLLLRLSFRSLSINLKSGLRAIACTWSMTLPGCALMLFSWYAGWQNSFNKGYELHAIGPATGLSGLLLFVAAMSYVPLAQARLAATGDWRCFFEFRTVWRIVRERWAGSLLLALAYLAAALPLTVLKTAVYFLPNHFPQMETWDGEQALRFLKAYFFWAAACFFPLFVLLRLLAGRLYAGGLLAALAQGTVRPHDLAPAELEALERLGLRGGRRRSPAGRFVRVLAWLGSRAGRALSGTALFLLWFLFVVKTVYLAEFLNFHPVLGWLNQELVQLPLLRYVPGRIESFWDAQLAPLVLIAIAWLACAALRSACRSFRETIRKC